MKALSSITSIVAFSLLISCNDTGNSKKENKEKDTTLTIAKEVPSEKDTPPPPPPTEPPTGEKMLPATLCFENEGLKYSLMIRIEYITENRTTVEVTSSEIGSSKKSKASFSCDMKGDTLLIKSVSNLPPAGDASEWIANKNWVIDANKPKQTLLIPFKAKNYETNKWEEVKYSFDPCQ